MGGGRGELCVQIRFVASAELAGLARGTCDLSGVRRRQPPSIRPSVRLSGIIPSLYPPSSLLLLLLLLTGALQRRQVPITHRANMLPVVLGTVCCTGTSVNKKHLKNVGPIRHYEPPHAHSPGVASGTVARRLHIDVHDTANDNDNTTTTTTRDRGDRYGPMEWAQ